jgi:hypothetical protein
MVINFGHELQIEDLRNHCAGTVMRLRDLLIGAVKVTPDSKRRDFYEFESDSTVYYIHRSPVTGTVFLLATWPSVAAPSLEFISTVEHPIN